jgi:hypothetical protein
MVPGCLMAIPDGRRAVSGVKTHGSSICMTLAQLR